MDHLPKCPNCGGVKLQFFIEFNSEPHGETFADEGAHCQECRANMPADQLIWPEEDHAKVS